MNNRDLAIPQHDERGRFAKGNTLSTGRPKGSRNKLSKDVLDSYRKLAQDGQFEEVMETLKTDNPTAWAKLINDAAIKLMEREDSGHGGLCEQCGGEIEGKMVLSVNFVGADDD